MRDAVVGPDAGIPSLVATAPDAEPPTWTADPRALQILIAEHSSLTASRSLSWNEAFSRTSIFFTSLSAAAVALALVGQATAFGGVFAAFLLIILPLMLFLGVATLVRLGQANNEDVTWVYGINRIRAGYVELVPGIEEMFVTGHGGSGEAMMRTFGFDPSGVRGQNTRLHALVTVPAVVGVVDAALAGIIVGFVAELATSSIAFAVASGLITLLAGVVVSAVYGRRTFVRHSARLRALDRARLARRAGQG
jgi:hypothetical protein